MRGSPGHLCESCAVLGSTCSAGCSAAGVSRTCKDCEQGTNITHYFHQDSTLVHKNTRDRVVGRREK